MISSFQNRVYSLVKNISKGEVLTYQQVAERVGSPKAYRAVGNILNKNYNKDIPCHRVIRSDGRLGGYNRGAIKKRAILKREKYI